MTRTKMKLGLAVPTGIGGAEAVLHDIARALARVPPVGAARELHLRALSCKGKMAGWGQHTPPNAVIEQTLDELLVLDLETQALRRTIK